jgi:hypothetical protein
VQMSRRRPGVPGRSIDAEEIDRIFELGLPPADTIAMFRRILAKSTDLAIVAADPFGDGDQSVPPTLSLRQSLRDVWSSSADWNFLTVRSDNSDVADLRRTITTQLRACSPFFLDCLWGDLTRVRQAIDAARGGSSRGLHDLLERRELVLNMAPLHAVTTGTRLLTNGVLLPAVCDAADHCGVVEALLAAGARIDARDIMGCSALHHATAYVGNTVSLRVARILLLHGANINAQNRLGNTPLHDPVMAGKVGWGPNFGCCTTRSLLAAP